MLLNSHREGPARRFGTMHFHWARFTVFHRELDLDNLVVIAIDGWRPTHTLPSRRTAHLLRLPIDLETAGIKALLLFPLPLVISTGGRDQINPILLATLDKLFGFCIIGVGQMLCRQQLLFLEGLMDHWRHVHIPMTSPTRLHMCNQAGRVCITTLGQMHLVADPP